MILIFQIFDKLKELLNNKKKEGFIEKYIISLNQKNEIEVLIVSNKVISKEMISNENIIKDNFDLILLSPEELEDDFFYLEIFKNNGDEVVNYKSTRRKLTNLLDPSNDFIPEIPVIAYYSYKGGMGRSTNLVITSTHLARHFKKKIVIIDCDFEAPGFSNFFLEEPSEPRYQNGLLEYFFNNELYDEVNLNEYSWEVSKEYSKDGEIRVIPAGNLDFKLYIENQEFPTNLSHYLEGLSRLDISSTEFIVEKFKKLISDIKEQFDPDVIFIDCRTGFTDIFGIAALKLASQIVGFFSNSVQNDPGLFQFVNSINQLVQTKETINPPIIVNSFSDPDFFDEFKNKVDNIIANIDLNDSSFQLSPIYFYFRYNETLAEIGTKREKRRNWLEQVDDKTLLRGYADVAEKINQFLINDYSEKTIKKGNNENLNEDIIKSDIESLVDFPRLQEEILTNLKGNWPDLYADSEGVDYQKEYDEKRIFYRDSMKDIFNFNKFIVLGNKGTGKSYLFQALKNEDITNEIKRQAQKSTLRIEFLHLVDKKDNYFISTNGLGTFKSEINEIGEFYTKFWKVYTWKSITDKIGDVIKFQSNVPHSFSIKNNDTENLKFIVEFIKDINNIIGVEKELEEIDLQLNSEQKDIIAIYDNLDLMVEPYKWQDEMSALINFWQFSNYKRIHSKLFLRSDLFKTVRGINNVQSLKNNIISIEWQKDEIFNYFFNLVKQYADEHFIQAVDIYDFKRVSSDAIEWKGEFKKRFRNIKQYQYDELTLRKLCWVFFGQYPDIKAHGESYDWLYKNVMNADETISVRPFLDLLSLSIDAYFKDFNKDSSAILPKRYYTQKPVRSNAVERHFRDLVTERGNEELKYIFDFIDKNEEYQFYQLLRDDLYDLLGKVISKNNLKTSIEDLEELLIINGIIKQIGNFKYSFAFLYKYRLGLKNRHRRKNKHKH